MPAYAVRQRHHSAPRLILLLIRRLPEPNPVFIVFARSLRRQLGVGQLHWVQQSTGRKAARGGKNSWKSPLLPSFSINSQRLTISNVVRPSVPFSLRNNPCSSGIPKTLPPYLLAGHA